MSGYPLIALKKISIIKLFVLFETHCRKLESVFFLSATFKIYLNIRMMCGDHFNNIDDLLTRYVSYMINLFMSLKRLGHKINFSENQFENHERPQYKPREINRCLR